MGNVYTYMSIGLAVFMAIVLLFGFLLGLLRGWKKSTLRFFIFVGVSVVVLLCMPLILKVTSESININGMSLQEYIASLIENQMPETAEVMAGAMTMASAMAVAAVGSIVYLVLFIVIQILTWIIYAICKLFLRKNKTAKKRRFIGGLIGLVQGLFVCFVFMIPVAGFTNVVYKVADSAETVFSASIEGETDPTKIEENERTLQTIKDAKKIASAYRKSMPGVIYGVGDLDIKTFDYLSTATVNGQKVKFSTEIDNFIKLTNSIVETFDLTKLLNFNDINAVKAYLQEPYSTDETTGEVVTNAEKLFEILSNGMFQSDVAKALMVDGVNYLASSTETTINSLTIEEQKALGFEGDITIARVTVKDINWKTEQENFTRVMSKLLIAGLDAYDIMGKENPDMSKLPYEQLGEAIDELKTMQLFEKVFDPALKRLLAVEKLVDGEELDPVTNQKVKITIAEMLEKQTRLNGAEKGIDLTAIKDYKNGVNFKDLFTTVGKTFALVDKMSGENFELGVGDLSEVLTSLQDLPEDLKPQVNDALKNAIGDVTVVGDKKLSDFAGAENWENLNLIECAPIIGSLVDVATAVQNVDTATGTLTSDEIKSVVDGVRNITTDYANLGDENKTAINTIVAGAINDIAGDTLVDVNTAVEDLAKETAIIDKVLNAKYCSEQVVLNEEEVVDAMLESTIVIDLLTGGETVPSIFETDKTEAEVQQILEQKEVPQDKIANYLKLFNCKAPQA